MQEIEQISWISRVGTILPDRANSFAQQLIVREEPHAGPTPLLCAAIAPLLLQLGPMHGAAGHLRVDRRLGLRDEIGQERQLIPLPALGAFDTSTLAGRDLERGDAGPSAEPHHRPPTACNCRTLRRAFGAEG